MSGGSLSDRDRRILASIARGARTTSDLARLYGTTQTAMEIALLRLQGLGELEQAPGRPDGRWRAAEKGAAA